MLALRHDPCVGDRQSMADVIWNVYDCQPDSEVPTLPNLVRLIAECPYRERVVTSIVTDAIELESAKDPFDIEKIESDSDTSAMLVHPV